MNMFAIMKTKRGPGAEITTTTLPTLKRDEVLVKVKVASICGTDLHIWEWNEWAQTRIKKLPFVFGHEFSGEIVELGPGVTGFNEGDAVSAETHIYDGTCTLCQTDRMHICRNLKILGVDTDGCFAEYIALPAQNAWKNDPNIPPEVASIQEPLGNAVQAALPKDNVEDIAGKTAAVIGCGPIGLMAIAVLRKLGATRVYATAGGLNQVRMELAHTMGADLVLSAKKEGAQLPQIILDETDGEGVDVVLEMSGAAAALRQSFEILRSGGRVSLLGIFDSPVTLNLNEAIIFKAAHIYGISGRRIYQTWHQVKGLLSDLVFQKKIASVITHQLPMSKIEDGINLIESKKAAKVVIKPK
ncbi:MAG: L-threonine 3-dehydrogenase [Candidatus Bathyarchaeota archaeon]|nr:MAG: L-threonine 3-dehydrogenase [Candidatus Bathyarchaeota archaeon]